jgi:hypothetical protein
MSMKKLVRLTAHTLRGRLLMPFLGVELMISPRRYRLAGAGHLLVGAMLGFAGGLSSDAAEYPTAEDEEKE